MNCWFKIEFNLTNRNLKFCNRSVLFCMKIISSEGIKLNFGAFFVFFLIFFSRRVSIIRGRVVTMTGQGIIGVRVSVDRAKDANNYGFTLTRPGGW